MRTELGFETIQFSSSLTGSAPDPDRLISAAKAAGFAWICFDRRTLVEQATRPGGLAALAEACRAHELPCRAVQSLVLSGADGADARSFDRLVGQVAVLRPDVVPVILTATPTAERIAILRDRIARLLDDHPALRFAVEFGPVFAVSSPPDALALIDRLGEPRVGLLLDTWHAFTGATTWAQLRDLDAGSVALVQLSDRGPLSTLDIETARRHRRLPGDGVLPIAKLLALLDEKGYAGLISVEVISTELRTLTPEEYSSRAMSSMARLLGHEG